MNIFWKGLAENIHFEAKIIRLVKLHQNVISCCGKHKKAREEEEQEEQEQEEQEEEEEEQQQQQQQQQYIISISIISKIKIKKSQHGDLFSFLPLYYFSLVLFTTHNKLVLGPEGSES